MSPKNRTKNAEESKTSPVFEVVWNMWMVGRSCYTLLRVHTRTIQTLQWRFDPIIVKISQSYVYRKIKYYQTAFLKILYKKWKLLNRQNKLFLLEKPSRVRTRVCSSYISTISCLIFVYSRINSFYFRLHFCIKLADSAAVRLAPIYIRIVDFICPITSSRHSCDASHRRRTVCETLSLDSHLTLTFF